MTLNEVTWTRLQADDGQVHHVDLSTGSSLCRRFCTTARGPACLFVTCPLCACLWRNVYPPVRYVTRPP